MCALVQVSRASFYRGWEQKAPGEAATALRDAVQRMAVAHRDYGYRRIARLVQDAGSLELSGIDQLWVADITYIRLRGEFVFLAVVLDAYSRKVIGWELGRTLETRLPLAALETALARRKPQPGLVHHSDRGTQYASNEYVSRLETCGAHLSMSRPGRPWENGKCESFMNTLKREEINGRRYLSLDDLRQHLEEFLEQTYNQTRLHSALEYRSPQQFEHSQTAGAKWSPAGLSFFRHEEIYSDVG